MTTKQISNEMIFERLGWDLDLKEFPDGSAYRRWVDKRGKNLPFHEKSNLPDPLHDLNATFKYEIYCGIGPRKAYQIMEDAWLEKWSPEKTALAICQAFMDLPVEESGH